MNINSTLASRALDLIDRGMCGTQKEAATFLSHLYDFAPSTIEKKITKGKKELAEKSNLTANVKECQDSPKLGVSQMVWYWLIRKQRKFAGFLKQFNSTIF